MALPELPIPPIFLGNDHGVASLRSNLAIKLRYFARRAASSTSVRTAKPVAPFS